MKCIKVVKNKKWKKFLNKNLVLPLLVLGLIVPGLQGQENGTFTRFQNQYPVTLCVFIPDLSTTISHKKNSSSFSPIQAPYQWKMVNVPSPDRSPRVYNYHNLGVFCKLDVKLDKVSKLPVRFRLGTQELVDRKEGKY